MPTYREALRINEQYAIDNNKEDSAIKILLLHFSNMSSSDLLTKMDEEMPPEDYKAFLYGVDRYVAKNIPVQHITGKEYFFGYEFIVNEDVLIPRFETEELVANTLMMYDELFASKPVKVLDIGTGSGCLAITLALEEKNMTVTATDISEKALKVAKANAEKLNANVEFLLGDLFEPVKGRTFDIIVSNPPYIPDDEIVDAIVKDREPHVALFGGADGLDMYRRFLQEVKPFLSERYLIAFEHAFDKAKELKKLIKQNLPTATIVQKKDLQGKDRMTFIYET